MPTSSQPNSSNYIENLPPEILMDGILNDINGKNLTVLVNRKWYELLLEQYGKESLNKFLKSDVSGNSLYTLWTRQKKLLKDETVLSFDDYVGVYLNAREILSKQGGYFNYHENSLLDAYRINDNVALLELPLLYYCSFLAKLPRFVSPATALTLLIISIAVKNWTLCRDILSTAFRNRKNISSENERWLESEILTRVHEIEVEKLLKYYDTWTRDLPLEILDDASTNEPAEGIDNLHDNALAGETDNLTDDSSSIDNATSFVSDSESDNYPTFTISSKIQAFKTLLKDKLPIRFSPGKKYDLEQKLCNIVLSKGMEDTRNFIKEYRGVLKWTRLYTLFDELEDGLWKPGEEEIANPDENLCYLFSNCPRLVQEAKLDGVLILAAAGFRKTLEHIASSHEYQNPWLYTAQKVKTKKKNKSSISKIISNLTSRSDVEFVSLFIEVAVDHGNFSAISSLLQHCDNITKEKIKAILIKELEEPSEKLVEFVLDTKLFPASEVIQTILPRDKKLALAKKRRACQLITLNRWADEHEGAISTADGVKDDIIQTLQQDLQRNLRKDVLEFVLNKQLIDISKVVEIVFPEDKQLPAKKEIVACQLITLNRLAEKKISFGINSKHLDKIITKKCENMSQILLEAPLETDNLSFERHIRKVFANLKELYSDLYDFFCFQKYSALLGAINDEKREEILKKLWSTFIQGFDYWSEKAHIDLNEQRNQAIERMPNTLAKPYQKSYCEESIKLNTDKVTCIEINIGPFRLPCPLNVGLAFVKLTKDFLVEKQIYEQIYALGEESSTYNSFMKLYELATTLLKNHRDEIVEIDVATFEHTTSLIKSILEKAENESNISNVKGSLEPSLSYRARP